MKNTPTVSRIIKLCIIAILLIPLTSCSHQEENGSVCLNIPSSVCERLAARAVSDGETMKVFVTGDYEAKKTVSYSLESLEQGGITVEFDGIRGGSKVRVVCVDGTDGDTYIMIGASNEVTIIGGEENAASVKLSSISLEFETGGGRVYLQDLFTETQKDLPSCTYRWYYKDNSDIEHVMTTSEGECIFTEENGAEMNIYSGTFMCTIYCNGTRIITLTKIEA
ncbi:MAG: hypothetical protein II110_10250 [Treponema sp.]|nr:hypothetical protein [Treponema sp.]